MQKIKIGGFSYKVRLVKFNYVDYYGLTNHKLRLILINASKSLHMQYYTLLHEVLHVSIEKFFFFIDSKTKSKLHGLHDIIDYLISDFKDAYTYCIIYKGFKYFLFKVINRYVDSYIA
jgi:hypothetical protein